MSHYYGSIDGSRGPATRQGTKNSGLAVAARTYDGSVIVRLDYRPATDDDWVTIGTGDGSTSQIDRVLWEGPLVDLLRVKALPVFE